MSDADSWILVKFGEKRWKPFLGCAIFVVALVLIIFLPLHLSRKPETDRGTDDREDKKYLLIAHMRSRRVVKLTQGERNIILRCSGRGYPTPTVRWIRDSKPIPFVNASRAGKLQVVQILQENRNEPFRNITSHLLLRTAGVLYSDAGNYTCVVSNQRGNVTKTTEVLFIPEFQQSPTNQTVLLGGFVTFLCNVSGVPSPVIDWTFNNGNLPNNSNTWDGNLDIFNVADDDSNEGRYTCSASSRAGSVKKTVSLTVDGSSFFFDLIFNDTLPLLSIPVNFPSPLTNFTVCLWATFSSLFSNRQVFFFYEKASQNISLVLSLLSDPLYGQEIEAVFTTPLYKYSNITGKIPWVRRNKWYSFCLSWISETGFAILYVDGTIRGAAIGVNTRGVVPESGLMWLGGRPKTNEFFYGEMSELAFWDRVLPIEEISQMGQNCRTPQNRGTLISWDMFDKRNKTHGRIRIPSKCGSENAIDDEPRGESEESSYRQSYSY